MSKSIFFTITVLALELVIIDSSYPTYNAYPDATGYAPNSVYDPGYEYGYKAPVTATPQSKTFVQNINSNDIEDVQSDPSAVDPNASARPALQPIIIPSVLPLHLTDLIARNRFYDPYNDPYYGLNRPYYNHHNHFGGFHNHHGHHGHHDHHGHDRPNNRFDISSIKNENENIRRLTNITRLNRNDKPNINILSKSEKPNIRILNKDDNSSSIQKLSLSKAKPKNENSQLETTLDLSTTKLNSQSSLELIKSLLQEKRSSHENKSNLDLILSTLRKINEPETTTTTTTSTPAPSLELITQLLKKKLANGKNDEKSTKIAALFESVLSSLNQNDDEADSNEEIDRSVESDQHGEESVDDEPNLENEPESYDSEQSD